MGEGFWKQTQSDCGAVVISVQVVKPAWGERFQLQSFPHAPLPKISQAGGWGVETGEEIEGRGASRLSYCMKTVLHLLIKTKSLSYK